MPTIPINLTDPGASPDRSDRATFAARAIALDEFTKNVQIPQLRLAMANVFGNAGDAFNGANTATTKATDAVNAANSAAAQVPLAAAQVTLATAAKDAAALSALTSAQSAALPGWVSGTSYAAGQRIISNLTARAYQSLTAGVSTVDPANDTARWQLISASRPVVNVTTTTQTATAGNHYVMTNAGLSTLTLPASPSNGAEVEITFANGRADNIVARNGKGLLVNNDGSIVLEDLVFDSPNSTLTLAYAQNAWRFKTEGSGLAISDSAGAAAIVVRNAEEATALALRNSTEAAALATRNNAETAARLARGYEPPVAYAASISLTRATQTVSYLGVVYAPGVADLPFTTSGTFETAKFRLVAGIMASDLAKSSGASTVGANAYQNQDQVNGQVISIKGSGALGDGIADDALAIIRAVTANPGKAIYMPDPSVEYRLASPITLPANTRLYGAGKRSTKLKKYFNGDAFIFGDGASISHATVDCNGGSFTGRGVAIGGNDGRQDCIDFRCINADGPALEFTSLSSGSQSSFTNCEFYRVNAGTGTGRFAVVMADGVQLAAVPRKFSGLETSGACAIDFGGCNDVFVIGSFISDVRFTANSRGVNISGGRLANQAALTVDGHNNSIVGGDIAPKITIAPGADAITIGPGSFNNLPVIDNSGNPRNNVHHWSLAYVPILTAGGNPPSLGNGGLDGSFSRQGHIRRININLFIGSTTSLGTGGIQFSLPEIHGIGLIAVVGTAIINRGGVIYTALVQIPGNVSYCELIRDTTGNITFNSPAVFAAGDTIRIGITC